MFSWWHTNYNTSHSWLGLIIVSNGRRTKSGNVLISGMQMSSHDYILQFKGFSRKRKIWTFLWLQTRRKKNVWFCSFQKFAYLGSTSENFWISGILMSSQNDILQFKWLFRKWKKKTKKKKNWSFDDPRPVKNDILCCFQKVASGNLNFWHFYGRHYSSHCRVK